MKYVYAATKVCVCLGGGGRGRGAMTVTWSLYILLAISCFTAPMLPHLCLVTRNTVDMSDDLSYDAHSCCMYSRALNSSFRRHIY